MEATAFNYREQLSTLFWRLDDTIATLFNTGFEIGLEEEWQDLRDSLKKGDSLPITLEYLRTIKHKTVPRIIEMAEILIEAQETLQNINHLTDEYLYLEEDDIEEVEDLFEDNEEDSDGNSKFGNVHYLEKWQQELQLDFFGVFAGIATLALQENPSTEVYDSFWYELYDGNLEMESSDYNVQFLLNALNRVLKVFGETRFY